MKQDIYELRRTLINRHVLVDQRYVRRFCLKYPKPRPVIVTHYVGVTNGNTTNTKPIFGWGLGK